MSSKIKKCPNCQETLHISEYTCPECDTTIKGTFQIDESSSPFDRFSDEDRYFLLVFLQCSGVIQDVEKVMGISYPTVKAKLKDIQRKLGSNGFDKNAGFDDEDFRSDIQQFKQNLKKKIRMQVRQHIHEGLGMKHGVGFGIGTDSPECCETDEPECPCESSSQDTADSKSQPKGENQSGDINEILGRLESGELTPDQASELIKKLRS